MSSVAQDIPLTNKDISMSIVTSSGQVVIQDAPDLEAKARRSILGVGQSIKQLLITNGIFPNSDAFGLVYDLNPSLKSINSANTGSELIIPFVRRPSGLALSAGQLVALTVNAQLKAELLAKLEGLNNQVASVNTLGLEQLTSSNEPRAILKSLRGINESSLIVRNVVRGKVRPVTDEVLNQLIAELDILQQANERLIQAPGSSTSEDLGIFKSIEDDLRIKRRALTDVKGPSEPPTRWRDVRVVVRTLGQNGQQSPKLRVYYVPEALRGRTKFIRSFDTLTSPSERVIPEANYVIWAGRPGEETEAAALTDIKRLQLRRTSDAPLTIDLAIIR